MWETGVRSLGQEDPLEKGMATPSSILAWRILMNRGAWRGPWGRKESDTTEWHTHTQSSCQCHGGFHPRSAIPTRCYCAFPPACPRVRRLFSLSLSPQMGSHLISFFLSLLVGWLRHSLRSYPHYIEASGDPIPLLDPTTGACGEPCSPSPVTCPWLELHVQVPRSAFLSSTPGFAGSRHLLQNSLLEKCPCSGKTLHQKDAHAVEKIMVHHYQNITCYHGNTEVEAPKTHFPLRPATLVCSQSIPSSSEQCFLKPWWASPKGFALHPGLPRGSRARLLEKVQVAKSAPGSPGRALALHLSLLDAVCWGRPGRWAEMLVGQRFSGGGARRMGSLPTRTPVSRELQAHWDKLRKEFLSLQSRYWILASPPLTTCVALGMSREFIQ